MKSALLLSRMKDDEEQSCDEDLGKVTVILILEPLEDLQRSHQTQLQENYATMELDQFQDPRKVVLCLCWVMTQERLGMEDFVLQD